MQPIVLWGSELSPFTLKLRACCEWAELPYDTLPDRGSRLENARASLRIELAKLRRTAVRYPSLDPLDEYPLVPFVIDGDGRVLYDSSALARWIDVCHPASAGPLCPEDEALGFLAGLIDEAFDEIGLYLVHHRRWVTSAATNDAGERLASEMRRVLPPGFGRLLARRFAARQVRRLPYLFSVAPPGFACGVSRQRTPPSRPGFPPTHELLAEIWRRWVDALEHLLARRPYLLGERFTLADASVYGQLGMNLADSSAAIALRERAPRTHAWITAIHERRHVGSTGPLALDDAILPLVAALLQTFVPLMRQNAAAYESARGRGERVFNERGFDTGRALYDGMLLDRPFRSVAKTFQVRVWRELQAAWRDLTPTARDRLTVVIGDPSAFA